MTLLVLEKGAEWPTWGTGIRTRAMNSAVAVQADDETMAAFEVRVLHRLSRLKKSGISLQAAGYACALRTGTQSTFRKRLCLHLLKELSSSPPTSAAELVLAGGSWDTEGDEGRARAQLIALWGELSEQVPGRLVSVRFEDPPCESGVFKAAEQLNSPNSNKVRRFL